uniref:HAT C-terminal dimerisation domain-containing protein n=1 Tax=Latimeria chalumnae TaxID=7897 RepID=H2ZWF1_LATCH
CNICSRILSCTHRGETDMKWHISRDNHTKTVKSQCKQQTLSSIFAAPKSDSGVKMATVVANHGIPLVFSNHLSPLLPDILPDSYSSSATKITCLINGAIATHFREKVVEVMKNSPYSLLIDAPNDTGLEKVNPLTVHMFDITISTQRIKSRLLDMCATAHIAIFDKIDQALDTYSIPWANCVGFVDNTRVNLRKRNSSTGGCIMTRVKEKNAACYFMGCPCHLVHNVACKSARSFTQLSGFDVEDLCVDLFYYFDKSTKRRSMLVEFSQFCDVKYRQVIKHVSTRWLSLEIAVQQNFYMYPALKSYFPSKSESLPCFKCLKTQFADPVLEVYLLFYNAVLPMFTTLNRYLQREDPCIFANQIQDFVKRVLGKFVSIRNIREARYVENVQFEGEENQPEEEELFIGYVTKQMLQKEIHVLQSCQFHVTAIKESIAKLPLDDNVLKHSRFLDFQRDKRTFTDVEFFVNTYSDLLLASPQDTEKLQEEFVDCPLLEDDSTYFRMDVIWGHLSSLKMADGSLKFGRISKAAKTVLVLLHSNAGEERVFSMVRKTKSPFRSSFKIDGTLASLITIKLANQEPCYNFESAKVLTKAKKATWNYNKEHINVTK